MGRSVIRGGKGKGDRQRAERVVVAAGNYLQRGRSIGASGAINYLRYVHYISLSLSLSPTHQARTHTHSTHTLSHTHSLYLSHPISLYQLFKVRTYALCVC